jgi:hypothetical protein
VTSGYPTVLLEDYEKMVEKSPINKLLRLQAMVLTANTVVSGRFNVVKDLQRTNYIVSFGRSRHMYNPS